MIDWDSVSDEEMREECQRRVDRGDRSPNVYMTRQQSDDRAKLDVLRTAILEANVACINSYECHDSLNAPALLCDQLDGIRGNPLPEQAFAVNTALFGREDRYKTHQQEMK